MNDRELDLAYERESDRLWEALNARDDDWDRKLDSVAYLNTALESLDSAIVRLCSAKDELDGMPEEYRLGSLIDELEDLTCDIRSTRDRFVEGD